MRAFCSLLPLVMIISGCASSKFVGRPGLEVVSGDSLPPPERQDIAIPGRPYVVGPSDQLSIDVFGVSELSRTVAVDQAGVVSLPLIGELVVSGKTSPEIAAEVAARLRGKYVRDPQVSVNITQAANLVFTVDGAVQTPGIYPFVGRMTLMRAIARSSGTSQYAKDDYVVVYRKARGQQYAALYNIRAIREGAYEDPEIYPADVIFVGESRARRVFQDLMTAAPLITTPIIALLR